MWALWVFGSIALYLAGFFTMARVVYVLDKDHDFFDSHYWDGFEQTMMSIFWPFVMFYIALKFGYRAATTAPTPKEKRRQKLAAAEKAQLEAERSQRKAERELQEFMNRTSKMLESGEPVDFQALMSDQKQVDDDNFHSRGENLPKRLMYGDPKY